MTLSLLIGIFVSGLFKEEVLGVFGGRVLMPRSAIPEPPARNVFRNIHGVVGSVQPPVFRQNYHAVPRFNAGALKPATSEPDHHHVTGPA